MQVPLIVFSPHIKVFRNAYSDELEKEIRRWTDKDQPFIVDQSVAVSDSGVIVASFMWMTLDEITAATKRQEHQFYFDRPKPHADTPA